MSQTATENFKGHTPGPWRASVETSRTWAVEAVHDPDVTIAEIPGPTTRPNAVTAANARLIASAPDLLAERDALKAQVAELREALEDTLTAFRDRGNGFPDRELHKSPADIESAARAALAKVQP